MKSTRKYDIYLTKFTFEEVLLVGTDTYTTLGRPLVNNAKVEGIIESISMS